jgi:hypothetical protein
MTESEMREMEQAVIKNGGKVKHFKGKDEKLVELRFQRYIKKHKVNIRFLTCRTVGKYMKVYSMYYLDK